MSTYSLGEVPPEPEEGAVVLDTEGRAWQHIGKLWITPGVVVKLFGQSDGAKTWAQLLIELGPLTQLVPAEVTVGRMREEMDSLHTKIGDANTALRRAWEAVHERDPEAASGWSSELPDAIRSMCPGTDDAAYALRRDLTGILGGDTATMADDELVVAVAKLEKVARSGYRPVRSTWTDPYRYAPSINLDPDETL